MAEEPLDENDPFYAFKKWGPNYRTKDEYWVWRHARDEKDREARENARREKKQNGLNFARYKAGQVGW